MGTTHAHFATVEAANGAFTALKGLLGQDAGGCDQKTILLPENGGKIAVRKMAPAQPGESPEPRGKGEGKGKGKGKGKGGKGKGGGKGGRGSGEKRKRDEDDAER